MYRERGADTWLPFSSGEPDSFMVAGAINSCNVIFVKNGVTSYHASQNRSGVISLINNGACSFLSDASAVSGTDGVISVKITKTGYYMIVYERTMGRGGVVQYSANQVIQTSCTDNLIRYLGDINPFV